MQENIFKKFSDNLKKTLILSENIAKEQNTDLNTDHQLIALSMIKDNLSSEILANYSATTEKIQLISSLLEKKGANISSNKDKISITVDAKKAIQVAVQIAAQYNHSVVDCEHLLMSLLSSKNFNSYVVIERIGIKPAIITQQVESIFGNIKDTLANHENISDSGYLNDMGDDIIGPLGGMPGLNPTLSRTKSESLLDMYTSNLNTLAQKNMLDPIIGRDKEIERISQILSRRIKNNPILIGEPGVGKTAIIEGLAQKIVENKVSEQLLGKEILSLDMGALIAGTMYRGQFEGRVKKLLEEIKKRKNIILFVDEIHTIVGAGSTEGSIDAANLLKPMLSRGELRLIGSTTFDEYRKNIEKDPAFERRFQQIKIEEPTEEESIKILSGIKHKYEQHHKVKYSRDALTAAVKYSRRYISDRFLPDKAIDLIDEAAAARTGISKNAIVLNTLKGNLREILRKKDELIVEEKYKEATLLREKEISIEQKINKLTLEIQKAEPEIITEQDIAHLVSKLTGIPISALTLEEKKKYLSLEKRLKKRIIGQDDAISSVAKAIRKARVGISNPNKPTGSFMFLGPTGVGKSELAKTLANELFGDQKSLVKIDMSEFMEKHNVSRLVGAPAGYIGYEEGGKLTEIIRKNPFSIVLLDEIEKAHPEVFNILLQIMEDGILTDAKGRKVDFKNTILIMTSNLGTDKIYRQGSIGFGKDSFEQDTDKIKGNVMEAVEKELKPEFINRLDKIIVFNPLSMESIKKIVEIEINDLSKRLKNNNLVLKLSTEAKSWIAKKGYDPKYGARPVKKVISEHLENPLSEILLSEEFTEKKVVRIDVKNGKLQLNIEKELS